MNNTITRGRFTLYIIEAKPVDYKYSHLAIYTMHLILIGIPNDTKMYLVKTLYLHIQTDFKGQVTTSLDLLSLLEAALLAVTHGRGKFALYEKPDPSTPHPALGDGDVIVDLTYGSASRTQGWWCTGGEELVELADDYLFEELGDVQEKVMNGNRRPLTSGAVMFRDYRGMPSTFSASALSGLCHG